VRGGLGGTDAFVLLPILLLAFGRTVVGGLTFGTAFEGLLDFCLELKNWNSSRNPWLQHNRHKAHKWRISGRWRNL
jgi:hypothetical protein